MEKPREKTEKMVKGGFWGVYVYCSAVMFSVFGFNVSSLVLMIFRWGFRGLDGFV